jgi:hypothetical protein
MLRNLLFDKLETDDTDSQLGSPTFIKNDINKEEIEAKMFENPKPKRAKNKVMAKQVFANISLNTAGFQWKSDQDSKIKINPTFAHQQQNYLNKDRKMLEKRRYGKVLKNRAMEKDLEIRNKRLDRELKNDLF